MTTTCLPCEMAATEAPADERIPETGGASWSGPIGMEGEATGDGRYIELNALRWDTLPVPLRWVESDNGAHDGAVVVGKITKIERNEQGHLIGFGDFDLGSDAGREAYRQVKEGLTPGVSMDLDDIVVSEEDDDTFKILEGRVRAATIVAIPAFEGARIAVSDVEQFDTAEAEADTVELNWVEEAGGLPEYIRDIADSLIQNGFAESRAIAVAVNAVKRWARGGPAREGGSGRVSSKTQAKAAAALAEWEAKKNMAAETTALTASAPVPPQEWFQDPGLFEPTGLTVTEDGRVYGHIALWGTCHIANPQGHGVCTQPPSSASNYAYFRTGMTTTTKGDIPTGKITMSTLHAGPKMSASDAVYHYEHTGSVGADVVAGEDAIGIWVAGAARPSADRVALKAAPISGDWRTIGGVLEMVGALSVNIPGFPVPRAQALVAGGAVQSLVASGIVLAEEKTLDVQTLELSDETVMTLRERFRDLDRREKAAALAARVDKAIKAERIRRVTAAISPGHRRAFAMRQSHTIVKQQVQIEKIRRLAVDLGVAFAYNKDQWRVPKGNGELSGRFIDMPDTAVGALEALMMDVADSGDLDERAAEELGDTLGLAVESAGAATVALRKGDGEAATKWATEADEHLSKLEAQLQDAIDTGGVNGPRINEIGTALDEARDGVTVVKDSDLSLLGDEGVDAGDAPEVDVDAPDAADIGAEAPAVGAPGSDPVAQEIEKTKQVPEGFPDGWTQDTRAPVPTYYDETGNVGVTQADDGSGWIPVMYNSETEEVDPMEGDWENPGPVFDTPQEALEAVMFGEDPGDIPEEEEAEPEVSTPTVPEAGGSPQQQAGNKVEATASALEGVLLDAEGELPENKVEAVGDALDSAREALAKLNEGIQDGNYNAADLLAAQTALSALEGVLMDAAEGPGLSDGTAASIGAALDAMFTDLDALAATLQGETTPPPFGVRLRRRAVLAHFNRRKEAV